MQDGGSGQGSQGLKSLLGLGADLLWGPAIETLQLFLPPAASCPGIKYWYLEVCAWVQPARWQAWHRCGSTAPSSPPQNALRTDMERQTNAQKCKKEGMELVACRAWELGTQADNKAPAHLELLVVIPVMDDDKRRSKRRLRSKRWSALPLSKHHHEGRAAIPALSTRAPALSTGGGGGGRGTGARPSRHVAQAAALTTVPPVDCPSLCWTKADPLPGTLHRTLEMFPEQGKKLDGLTKGPDRPSRTVALASGSTPGLTAQNTCS